MDDDRGLTMLKNLMELSEVPSKLTFDGLDSFAGMMHGRSKQFKHLWEISPFEIYEDENDTNPAVRICLPCK